MKFVEGMNYQQWQKRNTAHFKRLTESQKQKARQEGYSNIGWTRIQESWDIINQMLTLPSLFAHKLKKGDLVGAIEHSILEAEQANTLAKKAIEAINSKQEKLNNLVDRALEKYQLI